MVWIIQIIQMEMSTVPNMLVFVIRATAPPKRALAGYEQWQSSTDMPEAQVAVRLQVRYVYTILTMKFLFDWSKQFWNYYRFRS